VVLTFRYFVGLYAKFGLEDLKEMGSRTQVGGNVVWGMKKILLAHGRDPWLPFGYDGGHPDSVKGEIIFSTKTLYHVVS
jgi:hypothetical protein